MVTGTIAPLYPMGAPQPEALVVSGGAPKALAPLMWNDWTGNVQTVPQPTNTASNRPITPIKSGLTSELAALAALAQSLQETTHKVTEAHALFLSNQDAALNQIQQISHLLQAISDQN